MAKVRRLRQIVSSWRCESVKLDFPHCYSSTPSESNVYRITLATNIRPQRGRTLAQSICEIFKPARRENDYD